MSVTHLRALLGIELPIIQAPMAGVQGSGLAVAVARAGGLGSLPTATFDLPTMRREIMAIQEATAAPFNVNFFCHAVPQPDAAREASWRQRLAPFYAEEGVDPATIQSGAGRTRFDEEVADVLAELRPAVLSFHFGLPPESLLSRARAWGAKILSSATTVPEARWLEERGADAIIAQGLEAGGHRGHFLSDDLSAQMGTLALVPQIVDAVKVPVIAAGGIADARSAAAAVALGASGVQVGTAYLLCPEATTSAVQRAALKSDDAQVTTLTNLFTGRPARGMVNRLMRTLGPMRDDLPAFPLASAAIAPLRAKAEREGRGDYSSLWAGQNVSGCREVSAAEVTREIARAFA